MNATEILEKLIALGDTPRQIADNLNKLGIKGRIGSMCGCPLAEYIKKLGWPRTEVCRTTFQEGIGFPRHMLPLACIRFIEYFDRGEFPELKN